MLYRYPSKEMILSLLYDYNPKDCLEQEHKKKMISFCKNYDDCFERSCKIGHFTSSAWVVNSRESEVLLIHHRKLRIWLQLGGHADGESNLLSVAIKEVLEESPPGRPGRRRGWRTHPARCTTRSDHPERTPRRRHPPR